mmetsp:Transcript_7173/g.14376  ORF Transcript_7173/g.14376 Transcript_7173/m.14376 type:complete len:393 (-) Transcript_7173:19-1197(-)
MQNQCALLRRGLAAAALLYCLDGVVRKGWLHGKCKVLHHPGDERMGRILQRMQTLKERFWPVCWAHGTYAQFIPHTLWKAYHAGSLRFDRNIVKCQDGGEVAVDVFHAPKGQHELPPDAPILLILHTITGRTDDEVEFAKYAYYKGWRACVLLRRGHMGTLANPKFNIMGCVDDTHRMVGCVQELFPTACFIGACGISAGSGQIVSYIGQQPENSPVQAAVSLCPAYNIEEAFINFQSRSPRLAGFLLWGLKHFFITPNEELLRGELGFQQCLESTSVQEFVEAHVRFAGYSDLKEYLVASNPMEHYSGSKIPCLILNALDDPLCVEENIRYDIATKTENYSICLTQHGSHVAYREGIFGQGCFMHRVALDFLENARLENAATMASPPTRSR